MNLTWADLTKLSHYKLHFISNKEKRFNQERIIILLLY